MSFTVENLEEKNMVKLVIESTAEEFEAGLNTAYNKNKSKISLPGFRKGKAPRKMIEKMYGAEVFYEDAANSIIPDAYAKAADECGLELVSQPKINVTQLEAGINPFDNGSAYTDIMKTQALKQALTKYGFTAAFGGGRRDEEKSRAKERIFSFRNSAQAWDPKNQRPEMWKLYNTKIQKGESMRVFPISNWTEKDIWQYIQRENIEIVPLYFAKERPVIYRDGNIIMVDDDRLKLRPGEKIENKKVRFRTLGCYPLTGGIESEADTLDEIIDETLSAVSSERTSRVIDHEAAGSMERRKREGYF